jgi:hypothetical protein
MSCLRYINKKTYYGSSYNYPNFWNACRNHHFTCGICLEYKEEHGKRETVLEVSKNLNDPTKVEELLTIFEERKKEPIDYRRNGVITIFVGIGLYLLGYYAIGNILKSAGALVGLIGIGTMIAGYLYPNTGKELTNAVEEFEKK